MTDTKRHNVEMAGQQFWRVVVAIVAAVVALRLVALVFNRTDLFVDESQYWYWSLHPALGYYSKPPLIAWVIAATTSVFGHAEWAVRLASPLMHGATALLLGIVARDLGGFRAAGMTALVYLLMPGVSLSSGIISTDVPLLFLWAVALLAYTRWIAGGDGRWPVLLALALGLGLNAKYAMAFFMGCAIIHHAMTPSLRARLGAAGFWSPLIAGLLGLAPNAIWNLMNGSPTLRHTQDNMAWGAGFKLNHVLDFVGAQFFVFGPVALVVLLIAATGRMQSRDRDHDRMLLAFSLPILAVFVVQAIISRAYANWAATAYPAAAVLVGMLMAGVGRRWWVTLSLALGGVIAVLLAIGPVLAPSLRGRDLVGPYERLLGWHELAAQVRDEIVRTGAKTLVTGSRETAAAMLYYLRDLPIDIVAVPPSGLPRHHFEMAIPWTPLHPAPGLLLQVQADMPPSLPVQATAAATRLVVDTGISREGAWLTPVTW